MANGNFQGNKSVIDLNCSVSLNASTMARKFTQKIQQDGYIGLKLCAWLKVFKEGLYMKLPAIHPRPLTVLITAGSVPANYTVHILSNITIYSLTLTH